LTQESDLTQATGQISSQATWSDSEDGPTDLQNPAKNKVTVTSQTYQNYKSALKLWHAFDCPEMDKVGYPFPAEADNAIVKAIATYKRDIGIKKRKGIMPQKERNLQSVYEYAYPRRMEQLYVHAAPSRPQDININTLANGLLKI
jgi:hypothetical protein